MLRHSKIEITAKSILVSALLLSTAKSVQASHWQIQVVDQNGGGKYTSLLVDKLGNLHVSYVNDVFHHLNYAFWDHSLHKWFVMLVDSRCGGFSSMVLDSKQHAHIAYQAHGGEGLRHAQWDGVSWRIDNINVSAKLTEFYTSIALEAEDHPILSYYEILRPEGDEFLLHLRMVRWTGQFWANSTIDSTSGSGKFNSMATDSDGHAHIAYANVKYEDASLRYASWNGKSWDIEVLEGAQAPYPVYSVAMVLGKKNIPDITYTEVVNHRIKYATRRTGKWRFEVVDSLSHEAFPDRNGIALDDNGNPYMSYYDGGRGILKMARRHGEKWTSDVVDTNFAGLTSSIQIANGEVLIVYYDSPSNSLKCARRMLEATDSIN